MHVVNHLLRTILRLSTRRSIRAIIVVIAEVEQFMVVHIAGLGAGAAQPGEARRWGLFYAACWLQDRYVQRVVLRCVLQAD